MAKTPNFEIQAYEWVARYAHKGVDPTKVATELERLRKKRGGEYTPEDVVEAARSKRSSMHKLFEWDDTEAARQHRVTQAGTLLRSLQVVYVDMPKEPRRAYEIRYKERKTDKKEKLTLYTTTEEIVKDERSREMLIAECINAMMAIRRKFKFLNEMDRVFSELDRMAEEVMNE